MGLSTPLLLGALGLVLLVGALQQKADLAPSGGPQPARQIAYNMRLFHQAAINFKIANPAATGSLIVPAPGFLTDWRFVACSNDKTVVTYSNGLNTRQNRDLVAELQRQSVLPPELGNISRAPQVSGAPGYAGPVIAFASGIGLADGAVINSGAAAVTPACPLSSGVAALQTQALP